MGIIAIDLGTTNIKVAAYTSTLQEVGIESHNVEYMRDKGFVEFDAEVYFNSIVSLIKKCCAIPGFAAEKTQLVLTGQAESLVVVDSEGKPLRNGISWLDMRSDAECQELAAHFDSETCYKITGQPEIIPTWPLTKILWLKHNEPQLFGSVGKFLLVKDYILYRLTGQYVGEHSIYPFSHYFDVVKKEYWMEPLEYCGVNASQLPRLVKPCSIVGDILPEVLQQTGLAAGSRANAGTLDHFAGMIGTGNVELGLVSESAGTVSSIATFVETPFSSPARIPLYCGPFDNSYIYLPVCESGGISLEWFQKQFLTDVSFKDIDVQCAAKEVDPKLTFLPYLTGVNPPEFDPNATGVFYGANVAHDQYDFALAIMYGVASLLRKNIDYFRESGIVVEKIISTGGGAKSALWTQIKADICNVPVFIPKNHEAPCLGAAIIGAVTEGTFKDYASAIAASVVLDKEFTPNPNHEIYEKKYKLFKKIYDALTPVFGAEE